MTTVKVAVSGGENPIFAPYLAAVGKGYFKAQGIKIQQDIYESGTLAFSAFAGGSDDFCICGATQLMTSTEQGRNFVGVFNQYIGGAVVFVGAKKFEQSKGKDLAAYKGATWGYTAEGSVSQVFMARAANAAGLEWAKEKHAALGAVSAYIPSLKQGAADIITMDAASAARAINLGLGYPVLNTNDPSAVESIWGQQLGLPLVTTRSAIDKNPDLTQRFVNALYRGLRDVQAAGSDSAAVLALMPESFRSTTSGLYPVIFPFIKDAFASIDGSFTDKQITDTKTFGTKTGVLKDRTDVKKAFDNSFVQKAIKEGF
jgi:NitT/TauT family transport system substrate-binding protein